MFNRGIYKTNDQLSRRAIIQASATLGLGVSSPWVENAFAENKTYYGKGKKRVVRIFLPGGLSHLDSFDPKPGQDEIMGETKVIRTNTGIQVSEFFPELAKRMDRIALIRSMSSGDADHRRAVYLSNNSYPMLGTTKHPGLGAWVHRMRGKINPNLPASVSVGSSLSGLSSGYMGAEYDYFRCKAKDPLKGLVAADPNSKAFTKRLQLVTQMRKDFHSKFKYDSVAAYHSFYNDAIKFMRSEDLQAFDIEAEVPEMRKRYDVPYGDSLLLARRLIQQGVQFVNVNLGNWDFHFNLWDDDAFPRQGPQVDKAVATFLDDLMEQGLWKDTIVMFTTEFGRKPDLDYNGKTYGRGHHNRAFSSWLAGGPIRGGLVYGATNENGEKIIENEVSVQDYNATVASIMGLPLDKEVYSADNRPFTVARGGKTVKALFRA